MQSKITSISNPKIKALVRLRQKKSKEASLTIVEGLKETQLAIKSKVEITEAYICRDNLKDQDILNDLKKLKCKVFSITPQIFSRISYGQRNEGVLALCKAVPNSISRLKTKTNGLYVVVEQVEKPGNLGAILRTCDSVGVDGIIVCDQKAWVYSPNVVRASLGSVFSVEIYEAQKEEVVEFFKKNKITMYAATPKARKIYADCNFKKSTAIILGSEHDGLSEYFLKNADEKINIPMIGKVDSLNVSASTAILLYEIFRQRQYRN